MKYSALIWLLLSLFFTSAVQADEIRPAYLQLQQTAADTYNVLWKVPGRGDNERLSLYVIFPSSCETRLPPRATMVNNAFIERWSIQCAGGLIGKKIHVEGLLATSTDALVRVEKLDGTSQMARLSATESVFSVSATQDSLDVATTYLVLGVDHILAGIDHLLFVLALLLIVGRSWQPLIKTITAFTVAHSITLALATLGLVRAPQAPVEAVIALSIVFVAAEILHGRAGHPGLTARAPWIVAFGFGLLHGFGFAGALNEVGLPQNAVPLALLFFNVGVEVGQLIFVLAVVILISLLTRIRMVWPRWLESLPPYVIGSLAMFWVIQRVASF